MCVASRRLVDLYASDAGERSKWTQNRMSDDETSGGLGLYIE